ncbi:hypothetical protein CTAYLR_008730 [Chrysophaeum taylorii]|uniref:Coproporphyrinogen oxidase n=1 Tax=Chrysophaeum taylorii TaxID=2483200 RepID=A0AAD7ULY1_9STRA|nr:hypothetical protein CTAYLR_008730 [Chrysophaeum taylorii]
MLTLLVVLSALDDGAGGLQHHLLVSRFSKFLAEQQEELCAAIEALDASGQAFSRDAWSREDGSHGTARVLQGGDVVEKGGISTTFAVGVLSEERASAMRTRGRVVEAGNEYAATALSVVLHSRSPFVPTFRADARLFVVGEEAWFGGGADLTPSYLFEEDAVEWHAFWRDACGEHHSELYPRLKRWCDEYFYLPFRREHRGIGGIFFDDLDKTQLDDPESFARDVVAGFAPSWRAIVERRRDAAYTDAQRHWQLLRRGRYVEFNLLNDRGVRFGLSPDAIERVLVSAPPLVAWDYGRRDPPPDSEEARLLSVLKHPREW